MKKCCVIGSINMDMVTRTDKFPKPGESRVGSSFQTIPGGKGANQAVALGRLLGEARMAGCVGDDMYGNMYLTHFAENHIDISLIAKTKEMHTGIATIEVDDNGENHIVVVPGANNACSVSWLEGILPQLMHCDIFLLQLEIPIETVAFAVEKLSEAGKTIILDPAPARPIPADLLKRCTVVTPNATELRTITEELPESATVEDRINHLLQVGVDLVVHKSGSAGAYIADGTSLVHVPAFKVKAVDSTAAGDTFNAGLAAGLARGFSMEESVRLANAAAALSVTKLGAQGGMPDFETAMAFMEGK